MGDAIIVAIISGIFSLIAVLISGSLAAKKSETAMQVSLAKTDVKIEELTREVRLHNGFAQRLPVVEEQIKVINHRIDDLEKAVSE